MPFDATKVGLGVNIQTSGILDWAEKIEYFSNQFRVKW